MEEKAFETDCEDDLSKTEEDSNKKDRISFDNKIAAHRSNRLFQTFSQCDLPIDNAHPMFIDDETLLPIPRKSRLNSIEIYEKSCELLDLTSDWQIRDLITSDHIEIVDRSFSFNDFRAFATAIEPNLQSLTLRAVGLTPRTLNVICRGLSKCAHLKLLVKEKRFSIEKENIFVPFCSSSGFIVE